MDLKQAPGYLCSKLTFHLMTQQSITGFPFDVEGAKELSERIKILMKEIEDEVEPLLPPRPLKKGEEKDYTFPMKPFKMDGSLSVHGQKFLEKHSLTLIGVDHVQWNNELIKIEGGKLLPATARMTLGNQEDIKNFLLSEGWVPTLWNVKKDGRGKPLRDEKGKVITTTPKMQEMGRLCRNLEKLAGDVARKIVLWLSYRNRLSVIEGWLSSDRDDNRLSSGSSGITPSFRQKHQVVVNLPKADPTVVLGSEMRSLFVASRGNVLVGYDASALEARVEGHYTLPYPGGEEYASSLIERDVHLDTALSVFTEHVEHLYGTPRWNKEDPEIKPWRSKAKNIRYASGYGAAPPKIASMLGISVSEAEDILDRFWSAAKPLALFKEKLTRFWETTGEKKWIKGIDGRMVPTRNKHALVNAAFQSCGAIIMEYAGLYMDKWLGHIQVDTCKRPHYLYNGCRVERLAFMHDELVLQCPEDIAQEVGEMGVRSIVQAGKYLNLRVPLDGTYAVGSSWARCH